MKNRGREGEGKRENGRERRKGGYSLPQCMAPKLLEKDDASSSPFLCVA